MPDWVSSIGGYIVIVAFLGVAVVYLRGSRDKGTIATLESSNQSLLQWQTVAKGQIAELKDAALATKKIHDAEVKALEIRVVALEHENDRLQAVRPSAEVLAELSTTTESLRKHMEQHDADIKALLAKVTTRRAPA